MQQKRKINCGFGISVWCFNGRSLKVRNPTEVLIKNSGIRQRETVSGFHLTPC